MKIIWDKKKDEWLINNRGISFDLVKKLLLERNILDIVKNPNQKDYPDQKLIIFEHNNYVYYTPYKIVDQEIILQTIVPSRKFTKQYLKEDESNT